jgi:hypothetical protein
LDSYAPFSERFLIQETVMATLRLKPRTKPAEGEIKDAAGTMNRDQSPEQKDEAPQTAGATPASHGSLREYLKASH